MNIIVDNSITILMPSENWLTDGENFSDKVYLGKNASASNWRDATDDEYEEWQRKQAAPDEDEADISDYQNALNELGVKTDEA